jgi:pilus assembly protein CpaF
MAGRFTTSRRTSAPEFVPVEEPTAALEGVSWTVLPEPAPEPVAQQAANANPLLTDKLLDAKVRLHRRLIEEINLQAMERLPEDEIRVHITQLVTQYILVERLALNQQELNDFVSEILDEMTGLGPLEPLLKDPSIADILINGHECVYVERGADRDVSDHPGDRARLLRQRLARGPHQDGARSRRHLDGRRQLYHVPDGEFQDLIRWPESSTCSSTCSATARRCCWRCSSSWRRRC